MPMYTVRCPESGCNNSNLVFRTVDKRDENLPLCPLHYTHMQRTIEAPAVHASFRSYRSPASGRIIDSPGAEREELRRTGTSIYEAGMDKDIQRRSAELKEAAFRPIAESVDTLVRDLAVSGKLET